MSDLTHLKDIRGPILWGLWILWFGVWTVSGIWTAVIHRRPVIQHDALGSRMIQIVLAILAVLLWESRLPDLSSPLLAAGFIPPGVVITALGIGVSFWARFALDRNWSGLPVIRAGHELIQRGPYRFVRHPIYSGLLLALAGTVVADGAPLKWILIWFLLYAHVMIKIRSEDRLLEVTFGEGFKRFQKETPALVPRLRGRPSAPP